MKMWRSNPITVWFSQDASLLTRDREFLDAVQRGLDKVHYQMKDLEDTSQFPSLLAEHLALGRPDVYFTFHFGERETVLLFGIYPAYPTPIGRLH